MPAMTAFRRILLVLVTIALIGNLAAFGLVKMKGGSVPDDPVTDSKVKVIARIDDANQANIAAKAIKGIGVEVEVSKSHRMVEKVTGHRLVFEASSPEILKAVAETLQYKGYKQVKISEEGDKLYLGGTFKTQKEAARVMGKVQRQESIKFEIVNGVQEVKVPTSKLAIRDVDQETADKITGILGELGHTDFEQIPTGG